jgi:hypothetical protein
MQAQGAGVWLFGIGRKEAHFHETSFDPANFEKREHLAPDRLATIFN